MRYGRGHFKTSRVIITRFVLMAFLGLSMVMVPQLSGSRVQSPESNAALASSSSSGPTSITLPSNAALNSYIGTPVEFCTSTGNCELLNTLLGTNGIQALYAQVETDSNWQSPTQLTLPTNASSTNDPNIMIHIYQGLYLPESAKK